MSVFATAIITTVVGAGLTAGIAAATAPDAPGAPDYGAATAAGINADIDSLGERRRLEAAAKLGQSTLKRGYTKRAINGDQGVADAQSKVDQAQQILQSTPRTIDNLAGGSTSSGHGNTFQKIANPAYTAAQSQLDAAQRALSTASQNSTSGTTSYQYYDPSGNPVESTAALEDFAGLGDAEVAVQNARTIAEGNLQLQKDLGPETIDQTRALLKQADPEGWQARLDEISKINEQAGKTPDTSTSETLLKQFQDQLNYGDKLDPEQTANLERETTQATLRGQGNNVLGNAAIYKGAMEQGAAADARKATRQQQALAFLTSGATPDDITHRSSQQNISNLAAFLNGSTPQSQFSSLSGAQSGAVPFVGGTPLQSNVNPNAGAQGAQYALGATAAQQNAFKLNQSTPNPWTAGLSTALKGVPGIISAWNTPATAQAKYAGDPGMD